MKSRRGIALTLAVLALFLCISIVYLVRLKTLCCAREVQRLELRLVRLRRIGSNLYGVYFYNALKSLYYDFKTAVTSKSVFRGKLEEQATTLSHLFSDFFNVTAACDLAKIEGPYELADIPSSFKGVKGYGQGSTCFSVHLRCTLSDGFVIVRLNKTYMLCHPFRYFRAKKTVDGLSDEIRAVGVCNRSVLYRVAHRYLQSKLDGFEYSLRLSTEKRGDVCLVTLIVTVTDLKAVPNYIWPETRASVTFTRRIAFKDSALRP